MNKIVFSTDEQFTRPIITLYGQQALIDSGADIPACNDADFLSQHLMLKKLYYQKNPL